MGRPDGAHTHGSGGGGLGVALAAGAGAVLMAALLPTLLAIVHALLVALAVIVLVLGIAVTGFAVWLIRALRSSRRRATTGAAPAPWQPAQPAAAPRSVHRAALTAPQVHNHLHFHGLSPEEAAAVLRGSAWKETE